MATLSIVFWGFVSSFLATLVSAFSGGGSSLILLPVLLLATGGTYTAAFAITKTSAALLTAVSGKIHTKRTTLNRKIVLVITLASLIGTAVGTYILQFHFQEDLFKKLIGVTLILSALYILFLKKEIHQKNHAILLKDLLYLGFFTIILNIFNGLFGGTGIFMTAYLVFFLEMSFVVAIAHMLLSYLVVNVLQAVYLLLISPIDVFLLISVIAGSFFGSWLGTHLLYLKGNRFVKFASITVMIIIGINMIYKFI